MVRHVLITGTAFVCALALPIFSAIPAPALYLHVYERTPDLLADQSHGYLLVRPKTPQVKRLSLWYVRPEGDLALYACIKLASLMQDRQVPGLDLSAQAFVSDRDMPAIARSKAQFLSLSGTRVTDAGLGALRSLQRLSTVILPAAVTDAGISRLIQEHPALRELIAAGTAITDQAIPRVSTLRHIETLDLSGTQISDNSLAPLQKLKKLRRLTLGSRVGDEGIRRIRSIVSLRLLDLSDTHVSDRGIALISQLPLDTLFLSPGTTDAALHFLSKSRTLRRLDAGNAQVSDAGIAALQPMKQLEELAIGRTAVTAGMITSLATMPLLKTLDISETPVTREGLTILAKLPQLEVLSFSWEGAPLETDLAPLGAMPHLRLVIVNGKPLDSRHLSRLRSATTVPIEPAPRVALPTSSRRATLTEKIPLFDPTYGSMAENANILASTSAAPSGFSVIDSSPSFKSLPVTRGIRRVRAVEAEISSAHEDVWSAAPDTIAN